LKEVDGIQHLMLVLDPKSTTSSRQTSSVTIHNTVKKRLSKMERKRLEKQKQQQKLATNTNEKPNSTNDAGSSASAVNENASSLGEVAQHAKEATIVIQVRRGGRYRSDFIVSLLTKEDVCKSYAASITVQ
jgi:ATP-dependent 26S proteasome regulatory subunit